MSTVSELLTQIGYRTQRDQSSISTDTDPTQAECIGWMNQTINVITRKCAERQSDLGRTTASISLVDGTASYNDLATALIAPALLYNSQGKPYYGWLEKTYERVELNLTRLGSITDHGPDSTQEGEPDSFYIDGSNNLVFLPTPDASYTAKIPYYAKETALSATSDTVPFLGLFDDLIVEFCILRAQSRAEYELDFELKWYQYLSTQAERLIEQRKALVSGVIP